ncbi:MAG: bifunctional glutamate N-acetyltransferase/amino-acid acetyltransferase ArgJ [Firmicutes bacterium]|nr:bifunctional glutamate N-acetyltransferase/amino-acid acetyltransferase ArgJ [Bacillota bacterium]
MNAISLEKLPGGITAVQGIDATGVHCGLRKNGSEDLALLYSRKPAAAAGVFTTNKFKAAPLLVTEKHLHHPVRAIVINSGMANACTGEQGLADALYTAEIVAGELGIEKEEVLVASTGVIGVHIPLEKISDGIARAAQQLSPRGGAEAARAILTTDTQSKESACRVIAGEKSFVLGGMAKGAGMICPDMATMLAFLATDVQIERKTLQRALNEAVKHSFNLITVDGDTSTNDMVILLANGSCGLKIEEGASLWEPFNQALLRVCQELAYMIVADGEGATKIIKLTVRGAPDYEGARRLARAILNSPLVKTAFFGEDANWGRIITALGYTDVWFDPRRVDIFLGSLQVASGGEGVSFDEIRAKEVLRQREIPILVDLHLGGTEITAWGCDLSTEYVEINSAYRT